jgi:uncharacterized protein YeaO (DUF488 family)
LEKDLTPRDNLRQWFDHESAKWAASRTRYGAELRAHANAMRGLAAAARRGHVMLLYAARDERHNNAVALAELLKGRRRVRRGKPVAPARRKARK